jgi:hypothetical protein
MLPHLNDVVPQMLIFFEDPDQPGNLQAGVVQSVDSNDYIVHTHIRKFDGTSLSKTWIQRWTSPDKPDKIIRSKKQPPSCVPFVVRVPEAWLITTGEFSGPNCQLSDSTIYHLQCLGYT